VYVDETRCDHVARGVDLAAGTAGAAVGDRADASAGYGDVGAAGGGAAAVYDLSAAYQDVVH
jgi:hypothetical protein